MLIEGKMWRLTLLLLLSSAVNAQVIHYDRMIWINSIAVSYDGATTGMWERNCPGCREVGPAKLVLGPKPATGSMIGFGAAEVISASAIKNRKIRRIVQWGLIGAHVYCGTRNIVRYH